VAEKSGKGSQSNDASPCERVHNDLQRTGHSLPEAKRMGADHNSNKLKSTDAPLSRARVASLFVDATLRRFVERALFRDPGRFDNHRGFPPGFVGAETVGNPPCILNRVHRNVSLRLNLLADRLFKSSCSVATTCPVGNCSGVSFSRVGSCQRFC
jgi:hypothetical protein